MFFSSRSLGRHIPFCQFIFAPILGKWSDRVGRRPLLIFSQVGTLVGFLLLFAAHFLANPSGTGTSGMLAIFLLYFSRVLDGVSGGNISIATAYIADITTPENRAKGMGLIGAAFGIGFVFGPFIGGVVGKHLGLEWVPIAAAVFSAAALTLTILTLKESHHPGDPDPEGLRRYNASTIFDVLARPVIGMLILMAFVNGFAFAGMEQTFSLLIQQRAFGPETQSDPVKAARLASGACGYLFGVIGVIIAIIQGGLIGRLTKTFGEAALAITGPLLIAVGLVIVGSSGIWMPVWTGLIAGSAFLALGSSIFTPSVQSLVSRHADKREQGEVLGAFSGMASLARGLGPLLGGALFAYLWIGSVYYGSAPYYFSAGLCVVVSLWAITIRHKMSPPEAKAVSGPPGEPARPGTP